MTQHEITEKKPLLNEAGFLNEPGWSRSLVLDYERNKIKFPKWKIKEWDYYWVSDGRYVLAFTISDNGYMGLQSVTYLDLETKEEQTESLLVPFPLGKLKMPETTKSGDCSFSNNRLTLHFKNNGESRQIDCGFKNFYQGKDFSCQLTLNKTQKDNLAIATPFSKGKKHFYYNQKINGLRVSGKMTLGEKVVRFKPENTFATLDWGRGVWTYNNVWKWGNGNGVVDGKRVGFNLGYGFGDNSWATENILYYDGIGHKINHVTFNFNEENYLEPWELTSSDNRIGGIFTPLYDRKALTDFKILKSDQHQVFEYLNGFMQLDHGEKIILKDFLCFFERVHNKF